MFLGLWICIRIRIWICYSHVNTDPNMTPDPSIIKQNLDFFFILFYDFLLVFRIRIGIRNHMFLAILDPDPIVVVWIRRSRAVLICHGCQQYMPENKKPNKVIVHFQWIKGRNLDLTDSEQC
jgi:hypothetical protein